MIEKLFKILHQLPAWVPVLAMVGGIVLYVRFRKSWGWPFVRECERAQEAGDRAFVDANRKRISSSVTRLEKRIYKLACLHLRLKQVLQKHDPKKFAHDQERRGQSTIHGPPTWSD